MKHTKKVVSVLLAGTMAFSSIGVAPMMAFADEAEVQQEQATETKRYLEVNEGQVQDPFVDENGDPITVAQDFRFTVGRPGDRFDYYYGPGRVAGRDVIVLGGPYNAAYVGRNAFVGYNPYAVSAVGRNNSVVVSTSTRNRNKDYWNSDFIGFYIPTNRRTANAYAYGNLYYPTSISGYTRYNGQVSFDLYQQYAIASVEDVRLDLNRINTQVEKADIERVDSALKAIRNAKSWSAIEEELWAVRAIANKYGIPMYTDWYLPYDYDYSWNWRDYNWRWNYRPSDCRDYKEEEEKKTVNVYRLLNPANGDHVYNSSSAVRDKLIAEGWKSEGNAWKALEDSSKPVYQLRNTVTGRYHYTTNATERDNLVANKWENDGVAFYSSDSSATKVYRVLNPVNGSHFFTKSTTERNDLVKAGWADEGIAFYVGK